ncbi:4'-phosphopantetheinyl transferase [Plenodomus tracheiphilus IPT5]|uniref:holo-[acyl-carrier-protein] synthase n=1 Tax=Plenodomus tracheiphilus IPT5 TaxID=1408161 RepID=A0A6A7B7V6_9PLEO|nr:4'-phosphopantetheinyl transferase [Plenodomus tracheiphilus IPT5]
MDTATASGDVHRGLTCWLLDTRSLWPGNKITDSESACEALDLITPEEKENVTRKYHIADARMSLASALLKRLFIHHALGTPWKDIKFSRKRDPKHGKPCAILPNGSPAPVEFNISHQAGLVALVGSKTDQHEVELGVDIVCVNERNDLRTIDEEGFNGWIDIYSEIFSQEESFDMKYTGLSFPLLDGTIITPDLLGRHDRCCTRGQDLPVTLSNGEKRIVSSDLLIDAKLRRFYTYWAYKEAFIKLDGEALLAKWIPRLEFKNVRAPAPGSPARCSTHGVWGERVSDAEVWFSAKRGEDGPWGVVGSEGESKRLEDVRMEIVGFEEEFMIAVAVRGVVGGEEGEGVTGFRGLDLEGDVLSVARQA